jgi:hypothetical protein
VYCSTAYIKCYQPFPSQDAAGRCRRPTALGPTTVQAFNRLEGSRQRHHRGQGRHEQRSAQRSAGTDAVRIGALSGRLQARQLPFVQVQGVRDARKAADRTLWQEPWRRRKPQAAKGGADPRRSTTRDS